MCENPTLPSVQTSQPALHLHHKSRSRREMMCGMPNTAEIFDLAVILGFIPCMKQEAEESSSHSAFSLRLGSSRPLNLSSEECRPPLNSVISHLTRSQVRITERRCFTCAQLCSCDPSPSLSLSHFSYNVSFQQ